jgi:iron complex outermembrane receptor protein
MSAIVVTARRRNEDLEKVPISESVVTRSALLEQNVRSQADLQNVIPGLIVAGTASTSQFSYAIRGQTVDAFSGSQPGVLSYMNEFQATPVTQGAFYDLNSVQVLKGPQGTLFGRNTTGGAVLFTTAQPTDTLGGYITVRDGNYNDREVEAALNLPLSDTVQLRFAGVARKHDGYVKNLLNGRPQ